MRQRQIGHGIHIISAHFCAPRQSGMRTKPAGTEISVRIVGSIRPSSTAKTP